MVAIATTCIECNIVPAELNNIDARLAFLSRASAQHDLVERNLRPLGEAFDELVPPFAEIIGLPACNTCGSQPCANESFCEVCRTADRQRKPADEHTKFLKKLLDAKVGFDTAYRLILQRRQDRGAA